MLLLYYSNLPSGSDYFVHLVALASILKEIRVADQFTYTQRQEIYKFLITKDILKRRGKYAEIMNEYLPFSSILGLSRQEIKELVVTYFDPSVQVSGIKKVDKFFDEKERGVSAKLGSSNIETSDPKKLFSAIGSSRENDPTSLQEDVASSEIDPNILESLMTVLQISSASRRYQQLVAFIRNELTPFDAKRLVFQLKYGNSELQRVFQKTFPFGQQTTNNIFSLFTKIANGDQGLYEIRSIIKPGFVVRKQVIETFYRSLYKALKKEDNPGGGTEFDPVIRIINHGIANKAMTTNEVRICLIIFLKLLKEFKLPKLARLGYRTTQVFADLIEQGVRMSQDNPFDDFVEVFYKKLKTDIEKLPPVESLDQIQLYFLSLDETIGALSNVEPKSKILSSLRIAHNKRDDNTSMVLSLINDYRQKKPQGKITIDDLAIYDPVNENSLHEELKSRILAMEICYSNGNHTGLIALLGFYRLFLGDLNDELKLFQILKWVGNYVNDGKGSDFFDIDLARELYLETYVSIIQFAYHVRKLLTYHKGTPKLDLSLFEAHIKNTRWGVYKIDYFNRLKFSSKYLEPSYRLTEYMLNLHILAKKLEFELVNNTERELIRDLRINNMEVLKERRFMTNPGYPSLKDTKINIGYKSGNFEVYYISKPHEVRDYAENRFEDKADEYKVGTEAYVYLLHKEIQSYLFKIDYGYPPNRWNDFLLGNMYSTIYKNTEGIIHANRLFFRYIGYLPTLIFSGPASAIAEVVVDEITDRAVEAVLPDNEVAQFVAGLFLGFAGTPGVKELGTSKANRILRDQTIEELSKPGTRLIDDVDRLSVPSESKPLDVQSRLTDDVNRNLQRGLPKFDPSELASKIEIVEGIRRQYSGLDLKLLITSTGEIIKGKKGRIPPEWVDKIERSLPLQRMLADAESVKLYEIPHDTLVKSPPYFYQVNSMGSRYELWVKLRGEKNPRKLDGIVIDANGRTWIGESKFTFQDDIELEIAKLTELEKKHPEKFYEGSRDPRDSFHFGELDTKLLPQFKRYSELAKKYGMEGVAVRTNTDFVFQTFEQATEHLENVKTLVADWSWEEFKGFKAMSKKKQMSFLENISMKSSRAELGE
jgi:hypothetical protein